MFTSPFRLFALCFGVAAVASPLDREIILAPHAGVAREDVAIVRWQERARADAAKADTLERLGWAYVAKARRTQDAGFYKLAEKTADVIDGQVGVSAASRLLRGHVLHQLHRFRDAEALVRQLVTERGAPADWALLSDVLMEQGRLDEAVAALQRMVDASPGAEAYSRVAHLRWLKGDLDGAIAAMRSAVRAASPREGEIRAWLLTRCSAYRLQGGEISAALALAQAASRHAADYAPAEFACGRALLAGEDVPAAIVALQRAVELNPLPEYQWWLADALRLVNRAAEAARVEAALKARGELADPRTLALFLATRGEDIARSVRLARAELAQRGDVHSHDALAWALAAGGFTTAAEQAMQAALVAGTRDPRFFLHAGEIALARGESETAHARFAQAATAPAMLTPSERALLMRRLNAALGTAPMNLVQQTTTPK